MARLRAGDGGGNDRFLKDVGDDFGRKIRCSWLLCELPAPRTAPKLKEGGVMEPVRRLEKTLARLARGGERPAGTNEDGRARTRGLVVNLADLEALARRRAAGDLGRRIRRAEVLRAGGEAGVDTSLRDEGREGLLCAG